VRIFTATAVVASEGQFPSGGLERLQSQANDTRKNGGESLFEQPQVKPVLVATLISDSTITQPSEAGEALQRLVWQSKVNRSGRN
jgi:hypothetical protein